MESFINRSHRIGIIHKINSIIERHQKRILTVEDFDMLYELPIDELRRVLERIREQAHNLELQH
jgi:coproporphyrinogen III oxidase-like Fe-S oxidoreductase